MGVDLIRVFLFALLLIDARTADAQARRPVAETDLTTASRALAAGDLERAEQALRAFVKQHPREARAQVLLIRVHLARDEMDAAYVLARRAVRQHPGNVDVLYYLGLITRQMAAAELDRLVRTAPDSARVHQLQAEAFEAQERRADAEKEYAAALAADPHLLEALLGLAKLQRIRLACEEARVNYDRAEAIRPTFDGAYGLGVCLSYLQNDELAVTMFERAVKRNASAAVAWAGLGTSLVKLGRTADGITKLQRAVSLAPEMDEAHYMLGLAYQGTGDTARAQAAFAKAEQLRGAR